MYTLCGMEENGLIMNGVYGKCYIMHYTPSGVEKTRLPMTWRQCMVLDILWSVPYPVWKRMGLFITAGCMVHITWRTVWYRSSWQQDVWCDYTPSAMEKDWPLHESRMYGTCTAVRCLFVRLPVNVHKRKRLQQYKR